MFPILAKFADITIHTYGVMLAIGFLLGILLALREARRVGIDPNRILDLAFYFLIAGLLGSRLFYVLGHWDDFRSHPVEMIMFWQGGLVFYGGLILAFPVGLWYLRKYRLSFPAVADVIAPSIAIGQAFGRLGCFSAG
jgi:phosphatidylglycerol---prolipoprotein diacylglyceryl transferase